MPTTENTEGESVARAQLTYDLLQRAVTNKALHSEELVAKLIADLEGNSDANPLTSAQLLSIQTQLQQCATEMNLSASLVKKFSDMIDGIVQKIA